MIEMQVESSRPREPRSSPWPTGVQQYTPRCVNEEVIGDAMCHQLPANADGEVDAT